MGSDQDNQHENCHEKELVLTSDAARATQEIIEDTFKNNNLFVNGMLHELEKLSHDGTK